MGTEPSPPSVSSPPSSGSARGEAPCLVVSNLSKTYVGNRVLRDAGLTVESGQIHGLLGANGSGKSTFVKCVTGIVAPDSGAAIAVNGGSPRAAFSPLEADAAGIRVVHQEAPLIDSLPVADSIALHRGYPTRGIFTSSRSMRKRGREALAKLGIEIDPALPAGKLSAAQRAMVMLALALADVDDGRRLIVLDEPTASLPAGEASRFLDAVESAAAQGAGVLLVTHRLAEVSERCAAVTVLRDGAVVAHGPIAEFDEQRMIEEIVGPEDGSAVVAGGAASGLERFVPQGREPGASAVITARGLRGELVHDADLEVAAGEVLGVAGIVGSGASELGRLIAGVDPLRGGSLTLEGEEVTRGWGIREALARGVAYVPGDRMREGGIPGLTVAANLALPALRRYLRHPGEARAAFRTVIDTLRVRPPDPGRPFGTLSGGNQQKVIIGKWALLRPRAFVLDDPTAGVDPGAREDIYAVLEGLARAGTAILLISSEPEQLVRLCGRILVIKDGAIVDLLEGEAMTVNEISRAAM